jgi:hypothetical protein
LHIAGLFSPYLNLGHDILRLRMVVYVPKRIAKYARKNNQQRPPD